ncbi:unnamed protein product [Vitrella brassicaformis CCMP3155]|uniref:Replication factor A protein 3 n=1 Tax=Vitrella brassicaformis (strain CCMP3155) TaxID=1169540 RepID=A0A0G4EA37_VITBC|nr:unnamed protein product [Vitrella brassicaformis CCMP3155]|eukprot:CEL92081.1 unnamed protein product [Vitrella brassicaformis CCMP3155]
MDDAADDGAIKSAAVVLIEEISAGDVGKSVRVTGRCVSTSEHLIIADGPAQLEVIADGSGQVRENDMVQYIGELAREEGEAEGRLVLKARALRNVDGIDLAMYKRAVAMRRKMLGTQH